MFPSKDSSEGDSVCAPVLLLQAHPPISNVSWSVHTAGVTLTTGISELNSPPTHTHTQRTPTHAAVFLSLEPPMHTRISWLPFQSHLGILQKQLSKGVFGVPVMKLTGSCVERGWSTGRRGLARKLATGERLWWPYPSRSFFTHCFLSTTSCRTIQPSLPILINITFCPSTQGPGNWDWILQNCEPD